MSQVINMKKIPTLEELLNMSHEELAKYIYGDKWEKLTDLQKKAFLNIAKAIEDCYTAQA